MVKLLDWGECSDPQAGYLSLVIYMKTTLGGHYLEMPVSI